MSGDADIATKRLRLKIALEELREMKGFGTELVTIIIPPDRQISDARTMLQNEHGQAANINQGTRKNIQVQLNLQSRPKPIQDSGENGIALFVGAIIIGNNKTRMVNVVVDDPPQQLLSFEYRCDSTFELTQRRICWWTKSHTHYSSLMKQKQHTVLLQARESTFRNIWFQTLWASTVKVDNLHKDSSD